MHLRVAAVSIATLAAFGPAAESAWAETATRLKRPAPAWYTPQLHAQALAAGAKGIQVAQERFNLACPGGAPRGVSAGGCIVSPYGCTANFVFADSRSKYIGTARHCVKAVGSTVTMQVDTFTLAVVGKVVKVTAGDCPDDESKPSPGCTPGNDFALIRVDPAVAAKWGVNPAVPMIGGPRGVYVGCSSQVVKHYGHGYDQTVAQGKPEGGLATNWRTSGYGWTGAGLRGDSGSPVLLANGRAAGNFTHLIFGWRDYPGSNLAGTRITAILQLVGSKIHLVQQGGATTRSGPAACTTRAGTTGTAGQGTAGAVPTVGSDLPVVGDAPEVADLPGVGDLPVVGDVIDDDDDDDDDGGDGAGKDGGDEDDGGLLGGLGL